MTMAMARRLVVATTTASSARPSLPAAPRLELLVSSFFLIASTINSYAIGLNIHNIDTRIRSRSPIKFSRHLL
ncbi:hypothetical protein PCASD_25302 [Puccinia coronata f. sp. avenae]|uniref:Uncharacterized protein n=1 Tax=Puccinia coronata f. sp. avenae TaxID=200324 RepID=A0A2N5TI98_9BASI|nr:hypothetical protein PCASD_25302 [Puccinia coronata f. sp. avenae]